MNEKCECCVAALISTSGTFGHWIYVYGMMMIMVIAMTKRMIMMMVLVVMLALGNEQEDDGGGNDSDDDDDDYLITLESTVPGQPSSLRARPLTNSILISWTPPLNQEVIVRGYVVAYGIGAPHATRQILDAKQRYHTIKDLS